jgi:hypothetical protein
MEGETMREYRNAITCTVATANGFAMPYRARPVPPLQKIPSPKSVSTDVDPDLDKAALRESLAMRLRELAEKPGAKS